MNMKVSPLLSCLVVYVVVILFTLGGSKIGETHNSGVLNFIAASGNTYTYGTLDRKANSIDLSAVASGGAGSPQTIEGFQASMSYSIEVTATGTDFVGNPSKYIWGSSSNGITQGTSISNNWNVAEDPSEATASAAANVSNSTTYMERIIPEPPPTERRFRLVTLTHHHEVASNFPPDSDDNDGKHNVGAQSDPH